MVAEDVELQIEIDSSEWQWLQEAEYNIALTKSELEK